MERRLAAILVSDVVGYSRLMQLDEAGTLAALAERRKEILEPLVVKYHARIVKVMGDGVLIEFASAANAVACAVELQDGMKAANADLPEDRKIVLRIGVNLGDVMAQGNDLYGDGVNIAARLEALAEPGSVVVSQTVRNVLGKTKLRFEDLGEQSLKNIAEPVRVYRIGNLPEPAPTSGNGRAQPSKLSIAVLPFVNMSGDPEQEYFSDGITEDIITDLSKVSTLKVLSRNTVFTFKGKSVDVGQIARQLKVGHVLEGSVRKAAGRVRITAQLIDADDNHVWAERYDRDLSDIFALQDEISETIVTALKLKLQPERRRRSNLVQRIISMLTSSICWGVTISCGTAQGAWGSHFGSISRLWRSTPSTPVPGPWSPFARLACTGSENQRTPAWRWRKRRWPWTRA
jgi:adenylate cyclase